MSIPIWFWVVYGLSFLAAMAIMAAHIIRDERRRDRDGDTIFSLRCQLLNANDEIDCLRAQYQVAVEQLEKAIKREA